MLWSQHTNTPQVWLELELANYLMRTFSKFPIFLVWLDEFTENPELGEEDQAQMTEYARGFALAAILEDMDFLQRVSAAVQTDAVAHELSLEITAYLQMAIHRQLAH